MIQITSIRTTPRKVSQFISDWDKVAIAQSPNVTVCQQNKVRGTRILFIVEDNELLFSYITNTLFGNKGTMTCAGWELGGNPCGPNCMCKKLDWMR